MPSISLDSSPVAERSGQSLRNYRKGRYRGDDLCVPVGEFAESDQGLVQEIYRLLERLFAALQRHHLEGTPETLGLVQACIGSETDALFQLVRRLGVETLASRGSELMAKTIHDLRGGAMSALIGELQLACLRSANEVKMRQLFFLTRDHLKIMRNALLGLDDRKREADLLPKMHSVDLIAEKWQNAVVGNAEREIRLEVTCDFHGNIAECCVELGALDRVLYNLVNNACRHTASGRVKLAIQRPPQELEEPENLCFLVSNPVNPEDQRELLGRGDLQALFQPGISSTGSGFGLTVALDFVTNAFGLQTRAQALRGGYLGVQVAEQEFEIWFHWPLVPDV